MAWRARGLVVVVGLSVACAGASPPVVSAPSVARAPTPEPSSAPIDVDAGPPPATWTPPEGTDPELARVALEWIDGSGIVADPIGRVGCMVRVRSGSGALVSAYGLVVPPCDAPGSRDVIGLDGVSRPLVESADASEHSFASHVRTGIEYDAPDRSFATLVLLVRLGEPALALELARARVRYSHAPLSTLYAAGAMELARAHGEAAALAFVLGEMPGARDHAALGRRALDRAPAEARTEAQAIPLGAALDAIRESTEPPAVGSAADAIARRDLALLPDVLADLHTADVRALEQWARDDDVQIIPVLIDAGDRTELSRASTDCAMRLLCTVGDIARSIVGDHVAGMDPSDFHATMREMWERYFRGRSDAEGVEAILADPSAGTLAWVHAAQYLDGNAEQLESLSAATHASFAARISDLLVSGASAEDLCAMWLAAVHLAPASVAAQTREISRSSLPLPVDYRDYAFMTRMEAHDRDAGHDYVAWLDGHALDPIEADVLYGPWGVPVPAALHRWVDALVQRAATDVLADVWIAAALHGGHGLASRSITDHALAALTDHALICQASEGGLRCGERTIATRIVLPDGPVRRCDLYATALDHANALTQTRALFGDIVWDPRAPESERDVTATELAQALRRMRARRRSRD